MNVSGYVTNTTTNNNNIENIHTKNISSRITIITTTISKQTKTNSSITSNYWKVHLIMIIIFPPMASLIFCVILT